MTRPFHIYLLSDATGETLLAVAKAAVAQFAGFEPRQHLFPFVRNERMVDEVLETVRSAPGVVLFTLVNAGLRDRMLAGCHEADVPCVPLLDPVFSVLANYLGAETRAQPGRQHAMDAEYFHRIEALTFTMAHDDGQGAGDLSEADIILVGVSRTSKTPTCVYLANRGIKAANVPIVHDCSLPVELENLEGPLIVGLTTSADRLIQIRRNRLLMLKRSAEGDYVDLDAVREEVTLARHYFARHNWPVIDVTRRSIEETAAAILTLYERRQNGFPLHQPPEDNA